MTIKTNGAEWRRFYSDQAYWPEGAYHEDEEITIDGRIANGDTNLESVSDSAAMTVAGGAVFLKLGDDDGPSLELHFRRWRKAQSIVSISCEAPRDLADAVKAAIRAAGGTVR